MGICHSRCSLVTGIEVSWRCGKASSWHIQGLPAHRIFCLWCLSRQFRRPSGQSYSLRRFVCPPMLKFRRCDRSRWIRDGFSKSPSFGSAGSGILSAVNYDWCERESSHIKLYPVGGRRSFEDSTESPLWGWSSDGAIQSRCLGKGAFTVHFCVGACPSDWRLWRNWTSWRLDSKHSTKSWSHI